MRSSSSAWPIDSCTAIRYWSKGARPGRCIAQIDDLRRQPLATAESEKLAGQLRSPIDGAPHRIEPARRLGPARRGCASRSILPPIDISRLLKSCAMPAVSRPIASSFCEFAQRCARRLMVLDLLAQHPVCLVQPPLQHRTLAVGLAELPAGDNKAAAKTRPMPPITRSGARHHPRGNGRPAAGWRRGRSSPASGSGRHSW